jgi:hypothetical protein
MVGLKNRINARELTKNLKQAWKLEKKDTIARRKPEAKSWPKPSEERAAKTKNQNTIKENLVNQTAWKAVYSLKLSNTAKQKILKKRIGIQNLPKATNNTK